MSVFQRFSAEYVCRLTIKKMLASVEASIQKTLARIPEFSGDSDSSTQILITLSKLDSLKKWLLEELSGSSK